MPDRQPLAGRIALVTGASGGIGGAVALRLAEAGADVALGYGTHRAEAEAVAGEVRDRGRRTVTLAADLADPAAAEQLVAGTRAQLGEVDVLVANAGVGRRLAWDDPELDLDTWDRTLAVNLRAPWLLARATLPGMVERGFGRVLFVSSIAALTGGVVGPHYAASKAGLHGLLHHLASRVAGSGVTVNAIAPALIAGTRILPVDPHDPDAMPLPIPVGRLGTTDEVADLSLALLTNGYLTDKVVALDGGLHPS
ncbi:MAG TPA: SDR family NAD(P)-dependent oxidoreductase [Frankiaceae bacterium]